MSTTKTKDGLTLTLWGDQLVDQHGETHGALPDDLTGPAAIEQLAEALREAELLRLDEAGIVDEIRAEAEARAHESEEQHAELARIRARLWELDEQVIGPWEGQLADRFIRRDARVELPLGPVEVVWPKPRRTVSAGRPVSELVAPRGRADLALVITQAAQGPGATPQAIAQAVIDRWLRPQTSVAAPAQPQIRLTVAGAHVPLPDDPPPAPAS